MLIKVLENSKTYPCVQTVMENKSDIICLDSWLNPAHSQWWEQGIIWFIIWFVFFFLMSRNLAHIWKTTCYFSRFDYNKVVVSECACQRDRCSHETSQYSYCSEDTIKRHLIAYFLSDTLAFFVKKQSPSDEVQAH